jgi:hypothetical protein
MIPVPSTAIRFTGRLLSEADTNGARHLGAPARDYADGCPIRQLSFVVDATTLSEGGSMKYALLIYSGDAWETYNNLPEEKQKAVMGEYLAIAQGPGVYGGEQLQPVDTATTVRVQEGQTLTTDGPFADTKEVLGGFFLVEAADLDAALEIAARIPAARMGGAVEVRPIVER